MCEKNITKNKLQKMLIYTSDLLKANTDLLSKIDSKFGDGDHGITVGRIADCIRENSREWENTSMSEFLDTLGFEIMNVNGRFGRTFMGDTFSGIWSGNRK